MAKTSLTSIGIPYVFIAGYYHKVNERSIQELQTKSVILRIMMWQLCPSLASFSKKSSNLFMKSSDFISPAWWVTVINRSRWGAGSPVAHTRKQWGHNCGTPFRCRFAFPLEATASGCRDRTTRLLRPSCRSDASLSVFERTWKHLPSWISLKWCPLVPTGVRREKWSSRLLRQRFARSLPALQFVSEIVWSNVSNGRRELPPFCSWLPLRNRET
jgi:hypothetical protein